MKALKLPCWCQEGFKSYGYTSILTAITPFQPWNLCIPDTKEWDYVTRTWRFHNFLTQVAQTSNLLDSGEGAWMWRNCYDSLRFWSPSLCTSLGRLCTSFLGSLSVHLRIPILGYTLSYSQLCNASVSVWYNLVLLWNRGLQTFQYENHIVYFTNICILKKINVVNKGMLGFQAPLWRSQGRLGFQAHLWRPPRHAGMSGSSLEASKTC